MNLLDLLCAGSIVVLIAKIILAVYKTVECPEPEEVAAVTAIIDTGLVICLIACLTQVWGKP